MSDIAPVTASFDPAQLAALSPEARASFDASLKKVGLTPPTAAAPAAPAANPIVPATPPASTVAPDHPDASLSKGQMIAGYRNLIKFGADPETVKASAKARGIDLDGIDAERQAGAAASEAQREAGIIAELSAPPSPAGYQLRYADAGSMDTRELVKFDADVRSAFHAGGVPANLAQSLLDALTRTANTVAALPDKARELHFKEQGAQFAKLRGTDNIAVAQAAFNALPSKFREAMEAKFAFHSAAAQTALLAIGRAQAERQRRAAKP